MLATKAAMSLSFVVCAPLLLWATGVAHKQFTPLPKTLPGRNSSKLSNGWGMSGDAKDAKTQDLDRHKNRHKSPRSYDTSATFDAMLKATSGSAAFNVEKGAVITGYFLSSQPEKGESCNGHSKNSADWDTHCYLGATLNAKANERLIFEVTPRERFWSQDQIDSLQGKKIRITGWLLDDWKHKGESKADKPSNGKDWRGSCWEIHPVTKIEVAG
jgi:hypothetical protein